MRDTNICYLVASSYAVPISAGLDAHSDTPVEILHVLLLGHIKYFWKDAINNQLKNNRRKKDILAARISSFKVPGLGLSPLPGETLVRYAGSLVGRDFRAIAQIAPFVLHGLVSDECYETWNCLSRLVPLVWQPQIDNVDTHLVGRLLSCVVLLSQLWCYRVS